MREGKPCKDKENSLQVRRTANAKALQSEHSLDYININLREFLLEFIEVNKFKFIPKVFREVVSQDKWNSQYKKIITLSLYFLDVAKFA